MSLASNANLGDETRQEDPVSRHELVAAGNDVSVKEFSFTPGEGLPWHHHSQVFDVFYCIEGELVIERADVFTGERLETLKLATGERAKIEAGTAHRPHNPGAARCRYVLVQGGGTYDWLTF